MGSKRLASQERTSRMRNLSVHDSEGLYSGITTRVLADKLHRESIPESVDISEYIQSNKNTDMPRSRLSSIQGQPQGGSSRFLKGTAVPNSIIQNLNREKDERIEYKSSSDEILDKILRRLSSRKIEMEKQVNQVNQKYSDSSEKASFDNMQDVSSFNESWDILKERRKTAKKSGSAFRSTFEDIQQSIDDAKRIQQIASDTIKSEENLENKNLLAATSSKKLSRIVSDSQNLKTIFENNASTDASSAILPTLSSVKDIMLNQSLADSNKSMLSSQSTSVAPELKSDTKPKKAKRKLSKSRKASNASGSKSTDLKPKELSKEKSVKNKSADSSLGKKTPKPAKKISKTKKLEKTTALDTKITTKIKTTKTRNSRNIPIIVPP